MCYFSKLAIVYLFRTLINTLVVFIFQWWCFFLGINQIWLFWGKLQWIIASENMMDDLPNFRLSLRLCFLLTLVGSLLSWGEVNWLNFCMAPALYVWISWIRWWPAPRVPFFPHCLQSSWLQRCKTGHEMLQKREWESTKMTNVRLNSPNAWGICRNPWQVL